MPTKIKPKRGTGAPTTGDLEANEIAMDMAAGKLYVNNGGTIAVLANNYTLDADTTPQLGGNLDLNSNNIDGTGNIDITGAVTLSGDITGDSGDLNIVNSVNGSNIVLKVDDSAGTAYSAFSVKTDDYTKTDDTTGYRPFIESADSFKIGSAELSTSGDTPDNGEGDYLINGVVVEPVGNAWSTVNIFSTGQSAGKNPLYDRYGAGSLQEFNNGALIFSTANGLVDNPQALSDGQRVGSILFNVHDGDQYASVNSRASAAMVCSAIEDASNTNARAAEILFEFTPAGGSSGDGRNGIVEMRDEFVKIKPGGNDNLIVEDGRLEITVSEIDFTNLPTTDPAVEGRLWNDSGTVKISAG